MMQMSIPTAARLSLIAFESDTQRKATVLSSTAVHPGQ